jgi:hypothetical protein
MIRLTDLPPTGLPVALPVRPAATAPRSIAGPPARWFGSEVEAPGARIGSRFDPALRGLSVAQHASRVLDCLFDASGERA